jgi:hypothetical protein
VSPDTRKTGLSNIIFNDNAEALEWLAAQRWGTGGQTCPQCGDIDHHYWVPSRGLWKCRAKQCNKFFSVFSGTKFHATSLEPHQVTKLLFLWQESAEGMSSRELAGLVGRDYRAIHLQVMKLREALVQAQDTTPMTGVVEVDAAYFCRYVRPPNKGTGSSFRTKSKAKEVADETGTATPIAETSSAEGTQMTGSTTKELAKYQHNPNMHALVAFVQRLPDGGIARIRVAVIKTETQVDVLPLALEYVHESAMILTDEHGAYTPLISVVAEHTRIRHKTLFIDDAGNHTNHVECFFAEMRKAQEGAFHSIGLGYLLYYATEMAWRLEMRDKPNDVRLADLARRALRSGPPVQFADMCNKRPKAGKPKVEKPAAKGHAFEVPKGSVGTPVPQHRRKKRVSRDTPRPRPA